MKKVILVGLALLLWQCDSPKESMTQASFEYPETDKGDVVDEYFGTQVADPYRWLEDDNSEATKSWVSSQNTVTFSYLDSIPFRDKIKARLKELWSYERVSAPFQQGDFYYFYKNDGLQNQSVLYRKATLDGEAEVFLDPNTFSDDGTVSLAGSSFTEDGKLMAYLTSTSGSDWRTIKVKNTETGEELSDLIEYAKFTGIAWKGNEGFFYSAYDRPKEGDELSGMNNEHKVYYHKLGTPQTDDELIFGHKDVKARYIFAQTSDDGNFLVLSAAISTSGNAVYFKDLRKPDMDFVEVVGDYEHDHSLIYSEGETLYFTTNDGAPNTKVVTTTAENPVRETWTDLVPEAESVLESVGFAGGKMFLRYLEDAKAKVYQCNLEGEREREVTLPAIGSAYGFSGKREATELFYSFTSFTYPSSIYRYEIESGNSELYERPEVDFDPEAYVTKQVKYKSKDGTEIPMFIVHKKGIQMDGQNPTYLYSYGGFNISLTPSFSIARTFWLEKGGVFAMPNIRGGGEYGEAWHKAGTKQQKQNVFDDFIAAAEYLKSEGYTSTEKLAIAGGSNGGLLVGATMTQRPDLCAVALPAVGVLDMLRYHQFTAGAGWIADYGCADSSQAMFEYLQGYSPVHNVTEGTKYPATLVKTADHDDRVVPAHSFKFISELQAKHAGDNPVLIRIDTKAGHGAGKSTEQSINEWADTYSFTYQNMGENPFETPEKK
ncbi:MAG: prolyl oligopeptidase family serine peptidase [Bacteroidota bacterium]